MRALSAELRRQLELAVIEGRHTAEAGVRAAMSALGVRERAKPLHLSEEQARLRRDLRAKQRQLGGEYEVLVWDAAYEQWHKLLFARFLAENGLLRHPEFGVPVTLEECEELADEVGEPDGWSVAARFSAQILPGIFRLEDPCVQLRLAAEHRIALERSVGRLPSDVFAADDSLGWVYQYWQSERKDQVNASEAKIGGTDLGPVTQLFTENYMVRFLLENSLGAWWAARHPDSPLVKQFEYLRFDDSGQPAAGRFEGWPDRVADVTVMDPCCGSGHFLVDAFGMLWRMRAEEEGLDPIAAQDAVLSDNLFGLELDPRCVQIAMFAVALTAWKHGGGWRELPTPNIACSGIPARASLHEWTALAEGDERLARALERLRALFTDADTLGSLINPRRAAESAHSSGVQRSFDDVTFENMAPLLGQASARETSDPATLVLGLDAAGTAQAARFLTRHYSLVVTNVPYLSSAKQDEVLRSFASERHPDAKGDLAMTMLDRLCHFAGRSGTFGALVPDKFLYLRTYEHFRVRLLDCCTWNFLAYIGARGFSTPMYDLRIIIGLWSRDSPPVDHEVGGLSVEEVPDWVAKSGRLRTAPLVRVQQNRQKVHPNRRFSFEDLATTSAGRMLSDYAEGLVGMQSSDDPRYKMYFWEMATHAPRWERLQDVPTANVPWSGCSNVVRWEQGSGLLAAISVAWKGRNAWGRRGIIVARFGHFYASLYHGGKFHQNAAVILPSDVSLVPK